MKTLLTISTLSLYSDGVDVDAVLHQLYHYSDRVDALSLYNDSTLTPSLYSDRVDVAPLNFVDLTWRCTLIV